MRDAVIITVLGSPAPGGSKRAVTAGDGRARVIDASKRAAPWKLDVAQAAADAMQGRELLTGALVVTLCFYQQRPKGHYGTGRNAQLVRASAPAYPDRRPDVLKLARPVEDALTSVVWHDDAQIVSEHLYKRYGTPERCEIHVRPLEEEAQP